MNLTLKGTTKLPAPTAISVFVGIDWADAKHDICLLLLGEEDGRHMLIENTPLHDWVLKLIEEFDTRGSIYVATETYPQLTLFPLNSKPPESYARPCERAGPKATAGIAACKPNWSSTFTIPDPPLRPQITSSQRSQGLGLYR